MKVRSRITLGAAAVLAIAALAIAVLAGVFLLYSRPDFLMQMANQIWACF
jgi:hypothetical protein